MLNKKSRSGATLIETMVALVILGVIGVTLVRLMVTVESANNSARTRNQAINLSEQALEQVRGLVQTPGFGWGGLNTLAGGLAFGTYSPCTAYANGLLNSCAGNSCQVKDSSGVPHAGTSTNNMCQSVIVFRDISGVGVRSLVGWTEKGQNLYTEADTNFYNY